MERGTLLGRLSWQIGEVVVTRPETIRAKSITLDLPGWMGHRAGQHVDVRLTADDGYQAERSYSIASPPEEAPRVRLTVERNADAGATARLDGLCPPHRYPDATRSGLASRAAPTDIYLWPHPVRRNGRGQSCGTET